ncbi:MAG: condensation domain-containing protein, partial [Chloroflexota bacterium]
MTLISLLKDLKNKDIKLWLDGDTIQYKVGDGEPPEYLQTQIETHKADLVQILSRSQKTRQIEKVSRDGWLPLSYAQEGVWYLEQLNPGTTAHNMSSTWMLNGELDEGLLQGALTQITARHEVLRSAFQVVDGQPCISINEAEEIDFRSIDLSRFDATIQMAEAEKQIKAQQAIPLELGSPPLLRVCLFKLSPDRHILQIVIHHIISDAWSVGVLLREMCAAYDGRSGLLELPIQYVDFAAWQRQQLENENQARDLAYWKKQLKDAPALLELPTDFQRPPELDYAGDTIWGEIPAALFSRVESLSKTEGATPFMVLLSAFKLLLQRQSGTDDVVVGTPMVNRSQVETEDLIGFFLNNLALRTDLSNDPTFRQ